MNVSTIKESAVIRIGSDEIYLDGSWRPANVYVSPDGTPNAFEICKDNDGRIEIKETNVGSEKISGNSRIDRFDSIVKTLLTDHNLDVTINSYLFALYADTTGRGPFDRTIVHTLAWWIDHFGADDSITSIDELNKWTKKNHVEFNSAWFKGGEI